MSSPAITPRALRDPVLLLATGLGLGLLRPAPGTWGSLLGIPLAWALALLPLPAAVAIVVAAALVGVPLCAAASRRLGVSDHGGVVYDEIVGFCLGMLFLPMDVITVVLAFFFFRLFDIAKPWPVSWADDRLADGWGVMVDDLFAGLYAAAAVLGLQALVPGW